MESKSNKKTNKLNGHTVTKEEMKLDKLKKSIGRNSLCPCGSGKKYKNCCLNKQEKKSN